MSGVAVSRKKHSWENRGIGYSTLVFCILILLLVFANSANGTPNYVCGDADGNSLLNVSDVVYLVGYIFGGGTAPDPLLAGDCDLNEIVNISDAVYLLAYIFGGGPEPCYTAPGTLIGWFGCKYMPKGSPPDSTPANLDCLEWQYDGESILFLTHVNAAFNCCPDTILADIAVVGNTIVIEEDEYYESGCDCLCLFDVNYEITDLPPGEYTITVLGMYLDGSAPLEITINLTASPTGSYCIERDHYPWGEY